MHRSNTGTQGSGTIELWYTILYHLLRKNARNISMAHMYTRKDYLRRAKRKETERKMKEKKEKRSETKINMRS